MELAPRWFYFCSPFDLVPASSGNRTSFLLVDYALRMCLLAPHPIISDEGENSYAMRLMWLAPMIVRV